MFLNQTDRLQRSLLALFGIAILSILVLALLYFLQARTEENNRELASAGSQHIILVQGLVRSVVQAEASQRAFFLSNNPIYQEEFKATVVKLEAYMTELRRLNDLSASPTTKHSARLLDLAKIRVEQLQAWLTMDYEVGLKSTRDSIQTQEGKQLMDALRDTAERINEVERELIEQRALVAKQSSQQRINLLLGAAVVILLLLMMAFRVVRKATSRNADLLHQVRVKTQEIASINEFSSNLQSCSTVTEAHELFRHYMQRLFPECSGALYAMRSSRNLLHLATCWNEGESPFEEAMEPRDCWALRRGTPHEVTSPEHELSCRHLNPDPRPSLCVPLVSQSETIGMLHLRVEDSRQLSIVHARTNALVHHVSAALSGIFLRDALREHSIRDPMTQLFNRRYLEESITREMIRARRTGNHFSVIMADIDHFKTFNDNFGHQAGDAVIKSLAHHLQSSVRGEDVVCRYGGEEFLILLVGATHEQGLERAEFLQRTTVTLEVHSDVITLPTISASWGVATFPEHGESWEGVISAADAALYLSKRNGRNRVSSATELTKPNDLNNSEASENEQIELKSSPNLD